MKEGGEGGGTSSVSLEELITIPAFDDDSDNDKSGILISIGSSTYIVMEVVVVCCGRWW